jgi:glycyl-tRNA synthetase alpha chain
LILQPYDMEMGAGTFHPATTLRALGPNPWKAAYVQPSRRPKDGRYGENPNRLQHYYQYQVILKPSRRPAGPLSRARWHAIGIDKATTTSALSRTTGKAQRSAPGGLAGKCGAMAWKFRSSPISSRSAAIDCNPVSGELTYGLERIAMYVQGVENVYDLNFNGREGDEVTYGDVFLQAEEEYSRYNFEHADTEKLLRHFDDAEAECQALLKAGDEGDKHLMAMPAYDQCIKASHVFNLLDARGVISVTERQAYILRVRELAKGCCEAWAKTAGGSA